jgi:hypothetical protein
MAVLYVTEYARQGRDASGYQMVVADEPAIANQTIAIGVGSVQSAAFNALTKFIRVSTDAVCSVEFGTNPTATATTRRMPANSTEYFSVPLAGSYKIAVIVNT